jgi:brefeldin A-inhibited guanine nucleotide-exchange protein
VQLSLKFLEKDELANYSFQHEFLKPFDTVLAKSATVEMRELTLECIRQILHWRAAKIKSGWKNIFSALSLAARDGEKSVIALSSDIVHVILKQHFGLVCGSSMIVECTHCLVAFASNRLSAEIAVAAVEGIAICADALIKAESGHSLPAAPASPQAMADSTTGTGASSGASIDEEVLLRVCFPMLTGLSRIVMDARINVRTSALHTLFGIVRSHGHVYTPNLWRLIFRGVLFPIFDDVKYSGSESEFVDSEWLHTTCFTAFHLLVQVYSRHYEVLSPLIAADLLELMRDSIEQADESVGSIGITCFVEMIGLVGQRASAEEWERILLVLHRAFSHAELAELRNPADPADPSALGAALTVAPATAAGLRRLKGKCAMQLQLMDALHALLDVSRDKGIADIDAFVPRVEAEWHTLDELKSNAQLQLALTNGGWLPQVAPAFPFRERSFAPRLAKHSLCWSIFSQAHFGLAMSAGSAPRTL